MRKIKMLQKVSKYQLCNDCKAKFTLSLTTRKYLNKYPEIPVYCPYCRCRNVCSIDKKY